MLRESFLAQRQVKCLLLIGLLVNFLSISWAQFAGGDGSEQNPWQIQTAEHLNNIRNYLGEQHSDKHYIQTADIDLGTAPWNTGEGWNPIGDRNNAFQGQYDGDRYYISNLTIDRNSDYQGLFGYSFDASFYNTGLKDVDITGRDHVGGIVGRQDGVSRLQYCYVTGILTGSNYVAGIVGSTGNDDDLLVADSYSTANINTYSTNRNHYAGGIAGRLFRGDARRCYATGLITTEVPSTNVGAVIGGHSWGEISHVYWNTDTCGQERGIGDIIDSPGQTTLRLLQSVTYEGFDFHDIWAIDEGSFAYLQWQGEEAEEHNLPPLLPPLNLTATGSDRTVDLSWDAPEEELGVPDGYNVYRDNDMINDELVDVTTYRDTGLINWQAHMYYVTAVYGNEESMPGITVRGTPVSFAGGTGTIEDPYLVETAEHLDGVRRLLDLHFLQIADIDLGEAPWNEGEGWQPIGDRNNNFTGSYDGGYNRIYNLTINRFASYQGLFGYADGASFTKIGLRNVDIRIGDQTSHVGGLVGAAYNNTSITYCYVRGDVDGYESVGGVAGYMHSGANIVGSYSTGSVRGRSGRTTVGGLTGFKAAYNPQVTDSYSTMNVHGATGEIGGLVGRNHSGDIVRSYSTGTVTAENEEQSDIGGFVGSYVGGNVLNSYWDTEASERENSAAGQGRLTRQMTYPYDEDTYVGWNFDTIWEEDTQGNLNDGYPILFYQEFDDLQAPQVSSQIVIVDNTEYIRLSWEAVEAATSYKVFASDDPYADHWGEPIAVVTETYFAEPVTAGEKKFYYVVAAVE